jgi:nitroimidazol reductase NimA-like FMN-containing flavoprotein (pyridoxamine 5'-phosphate oxidase superfamily)
MPKRTLARRSAPKAGTHPSKTARKDPPSADRPFAPGYGIVDAKDGLGLLPWTWIARKMRGCRTFWLGTIHPGATPAAGARPHVMPVWGVWLDDAFFFSTGRKSRKGQNLAANPACTVTNDDGEEAVIVEGRARVVEDPAALDRVASAYKKKYKMDPRGMGEPIFQVAPAKVFAFIEKSFPKSATRWKP